MQLLTQVTRLLPLTQEPQTAFLDPGFSPAQPRPASVNANIWRWTRAHRTTLSLCLWNNFLKPYVDLGMGYDAQNGPKENPTYFAICYATFNKIRQLPLLWISRKTSTMPKAFLTQRCFMQKKKSFKPMYSF